MQNTTPASPLSPVTTDWQTHCGFRSVSLFGIPIAAVTLDEMLDIAHISITERRSLHVGVVNAAKVVNMVRNPALGDDVNSSDIILADGASVVLAGKVLGEQLPGRLTGIDLMYGLLERGGQHGYRVFCLGATDEVLNTVVNKIRQQYPGVVLAGSRNGYFSDDEEQEVADQIRDSQADILFVAITSPKKEQFMARWNQHMGVTLVHGVGGSFDVMAGKVKRAPALWQKLGLEWLYRVVQEPGRLWRRYLVTNTLFVLFLFREWLARLRPSSRS